jgi:26S proteasome regulatory subunit T3
MDGFDQATTIKVIMATNRADTLDPALLRPGRLDRKIEFPLPDRRQKRLVFQVSLGYYKSLLCAKALCYF